MFLFLRLGLQFHALSLFVFFGRKCFGDCTAIVLHREPSATLPLTISSLKGGVNISLGVIVGSEQLMDLFFAIIIIKSHSVSKQ